MQPMGWPQGPDSSLLSGFNLQHMLNTQPLPAPSVAPKPEPGFPLPLQQPPLSSALPLNLELNHNAVLQQIGCHSPASSNSGQFSFHSGEGAGAGAGTPANSSADAAPSTTAGPSASTDGVYRSQYRGVSYDKKKRKWRVQIKVAALGKSGVSVGYFDTEDAAAKAYDKAAIGLLGRQNCRAILNFSMEEYDKEPVPELVGKSREEVKATLKSERAKLPRRRLTNRRRTSKYLGVGSSNRKNQWQARILYHGKVTHLGYYRTEEEAARVYDKVSISLHGENAQTNFPLSDYQEEVEKLHEQLSGLGREALQRALGVKPMDKSSQYRGVSKKKGKWEAKVMLNRKWAYRELFDTEIQAARAYDAAVWRLKPREAKSYVNFKDSCPPDVAEMLKKIESDQHHLMMTPQGLPVTAKPLIDAGLLYDEEGTSIKNNLMARVVSSSDLGSLMHSESSQSQEPQQTPPAQLSKPGMSRSASFPAIASLEGSATSPSSAFGDSTCSVPCPGQPGPQMTLGMPRVQSVPHMGMYGGLGDPYSLMAMNQQLKATASLPQLPLHGYLPHLNPALMGLAPNPLLQAAPHMAGMFLPGMPAVFHNPTTAPIPPEPDFSNIFAGVQGFSSGGMVRSVSCGNLGMAPLHNLNHLQQTGVVPSQSPNMVPSGPMTPSPTNSGSPKPLLVRVGSEAHLINSQPTKRSLHRISSEPHISSMASADSPPLDTGSPVRHTRSQGLQRVKSMATLQPIDEMAATMSFPTAPVKTEEELDYASSLLGCSLTARTPNLRTGGLDSGGRTSPESPGRLVDFPSPQVSSPWLTGRASGPTTVATGMTSARYPFTHNFPDLDLGMLSQNEEANVTCVETGFGDVLDGLPSPSLKRGGGEGATAGQSRNNGDKWGELSPNLIALLDRSDSPFLMEGGMQIGGEELDMTMAFLSEDPGLGSPTLDALGADAGVDVWGASGNDGDLGPLVYTDSVMVDLYPPLMMKDEQEMRLE